MDLSALLSSDRLQVHRKFKGLLSRPKYTVLTPSEQVILTSHRLDGINNYALSDAREQEVIRLRQPIRMGTRKMKVSVTGSVACIIRQKSTWMDTVFFINDANDQPALRVKGYTNTAAGRVYEMQNLKKLAIGQIVRQEKSIWSFSSSSDYFLHFPVDLDLRFKAAAIGAAILIDQIILAESSNVDS